MSGLGDQGGSILTQALDGSWVIMAALALEAKALWRKERAEGCPYFGINPNPIFKTFYEHMRVLFSLPG